MKLGPSWEDASLSDAQEISQHFMEPKVLYRVNKSRPMFTILIQKNPVRTTQSCFTYVPF
jgi:hypothetical protein